MSTPMNVEEQLEHQPPTKKSRMDVDDPISQEEPPEIVIQNDGSTSEVQIRELEISTMNKKGELNELKFEMIASKDEFAEKLSSLEEKYQKKVAELEMKNQKLTEENKAFEEKLKKLEEMVQMNEQKINKAEDEIMVSIHEMKVQLPLENWHDLLAFVRRSQLGNVVSQIGDRRFAYIIQSFLYDEVREITLGDMRIIAPRPDVPSDQPMVKVWPKAATNIPDWPMPANIKDFELIYLKYVDTSVLNFVGKFQENSLLENVNLYVRYCDYNTRILYEHTLLRVLTHILPLISSFNSIQMDSSDIDLFQMVYNNNNNTDYFFYNKKFWYGQSHESQLLLKEMMAKTRIALIRWHLFGYGYDELECSWEDKINWFCTWLYTPRDDGKPRMLISHDEFDEGTDCATFIERIKKDFEMANNLISFFIYTRIDKYDNVDDISLENLKTNEKLVIKKIKMKSDDDDDDDDDDEWKLLVSRYPLNAAKSWIEATEKEIYEWDPEKLKRKINMDGELTIEM